MLSQTVMWIIYAVILIIGGVAGYFIGKAIGGPKPKVTNTMGTVVAVGGKTPATTSQLIMYTGIGLIVALIIIALVWYFTSKMGGSSPSY
jgi:hypothetical protein